MDNKIPTYKIVDGILERLPNDERRPGHRYRSVCDFRFNDGKQYDVEFTEDEERDRDLEEADWAAKQPEREEEARKALADAEKFRESLVYERRIIAFVDILGWTEAIRKTVGDEDRVKKLGITLDYVEKFAEFIRLSNEMRLQSGMAEVKLTHFSDCIVITTQNSKEGWEAMIRHLNSLVSSMLMNGFFLRGGITVGDIIHRQYLLFGPGLIAAYELESKKAIYPRIIVDREIPIELTNDIAAVDKTGTILGFIRQWRTDNDGERYYDFIRPFHIYPPIRPDDKKRSLDPIRRIIVDGLMENKNDSKVYLKYVWLAKYFNVILAEEPIVEIKPIPLRKVTRRGLCGSIGFRLLTGGSLH